MIVKFPPHRTRPPVVGGEGAAARTSRRRGAQGIRIITVRKPLASSGGYPRRAVPTDSLTSVRVLRARRNDLSKKNIKHPIQKSVYFPFYIFLCRISNRLTVNVVEVRDARAAVRRAWYGSSAGLCRTVVDTVTAAAATVDDGRRRHRFYCWLSAAAAVS